MKKEAQVIIVGGGHAGYEAALASSRMGVKTLMITLDKTKIGRLPCNPAVGGIAKSHLVSEIDALGGEIGKNADFTGIQYRMLNTRKGPAVQSNRIQCDKDIGCTFDSFQFCISFDGIGFPSTCKTWHTS